MWLILLPVLLVVLLVVASAVGVICRRRRVPVNRPCACCRGLQRQSKPTLVIIDVESVYEAAKSILEPCCRLLREAMRDGWNIVIVEMQDGTHPALMAELTAGPYPHHAVVKKKNYDGSHEALAACNQCAYNIGYFKVAGLYSDICVKETVSGLSKLCPDARIEVLQDCCISYAEFDKRSFDWNSFPALQNVVLLPLAHTLCQTRGCATAAV